MQNRCETQFKIQKHTFSKINLFVEEKRNQQKESKKKPSGHFNTKGFFLFEKVEKHEIGGAKGDKKKEREDTKQFEPDGKWHKKNMCSKKKKQEEREKHKENKVKKEKKGTNK